MEIIIIKRSIVLIILTIGITISLMARGNPDKSMESNKIEYLDSEKNNISDLLIIYPEDGSPTEFLAAKEIRRYIYLRTGRFLSVMGVKSIPQTGNLILVANSNDSLVRNIDLGYTAKSGEIIIKTINNNNRNVLAISGFDSASTLIAAYRFAETLNISFDLAGDIIPDKKIKLSLSNYDEVGTPLFETRGIQPFHDFFQGPDIWNTDDYKAIINQLPKLGMNFIGLKTYTKYSMQEEEAAVNGPEQGPEPIVWIGLPKDINTDGTVKWSYPAYTAHTKRPNRIWGTTTLDTSKFHAGAQNIFPTDGWGADYMGDSMPFYNNVTDFDVNGFNSIFNEHGLMLKEAFGLAKRIGVKTAIGTELPLGLEIKGNSEVTNDWVRGMSPELKTHLKNNGKDPANPDIVKEVYKGIFTRIMRMHHLDYYWLWTYERFQYPGDDATPYTKDQIDAIKKDITYAQSALNELQSKTDSNKPSFKLGMAGWMLGVQDNPAEFEDIFPNDAPFMSLWDEAAGFDKLSKDRVKWAGSWLEEDWGLGQAQLGLPRIYKDAKAAIEFECDGLIAKHWRTKILSANTSAMKDLIWVYGTTSNPPEKEFTSLNKKSWTKALWKKWANKQFGIEVGTQVANILIKMDIAGEPGSKKSIPSINGWESDMEDTNSSPSAISENTASWDKEEKKYKFVKQLENLRINVKGIGNLERFDYFLKNFQAMKLMAEFGVIRNNFEIEISEENWQKALKYRTQMARLFEDFMTLKIESIKNISDIGEIISLEILNWHQLIELKYDELLSEGLGTQIPDTSNPSTNYTGEAFIKVVPARSIVKKNESMLIRVLSMGTDSSIILRYRTIGGNKWTNLPLTNIARSVYEVNLPAQSEDFEYYIESEEVVFPKTVPNIYHTVIVEP